MKNKNKISTLIAIIAVIIALCSLATSILMINQLSEIIKKNKEQIQELSLNYKKINTRLFGQEEEYDVSNFTEIIPSDIKTLSKNKKIVVYVGRESCGYCHYFAPVLDEIQYYYNLNIYYIDIAKFIDYNKNPVEVTDIIANNAMLSLSGNQKGKEILEGYKSTPMLLIIKDNKVINGQLGYSDTDEVAQIIEEEGFKKR